MNQIASSVAEVLKQHYTDKDVLWQTEGDSENYTCADLITKLINLF